MSLVKIQKKLLVSYLPTQILLHYNTKLMGLELQTRDFNW